MKKQTVAVLLASGLFAVLAVVLLRGKPVKSTPVQQRVEETRPSPLVERLPRPPLKIVDESASVRTRKAESPKPPPKAAESFDKVGGTNWAVVAAIYREYEAAERRAKSMAGDPKFRPTVFPEKGQGSKYMVVLGSGLTRAKAEELRLQATNAGLPSDTYVTILNP
jgi:hypothetical protein